MLGESCHVSGASWLRWSVASLWSRWSVVSLPCCWPLPPRIMNIIPTIISGHAKKSRERQGLLEGTSSAEQDDEHDRPDAEHPEQVVLPAVVVTLHVGVHVLGPFVCWSGVLRNSCYSKVGVEPMQIGAGMMKKCSRSTQVRRLAVRSLPCRVASGLQLVADGSGAGSGRSGRRRLSRSPAPRAGVGSGRRVRPQMGERCRPVG